MKKYISIWLVLMVSSGLLPQVLLASALANAGMLKDSTILLKKGTLVNLELFRDLNSNDLQAGNPIEMSVYLPVTIDGLTVIKPDVYAEGEATLVRKAGIYGRPGFISLQATNVLAIDGQRIPLDGAALKKTGKDRRLFAWAGSLILPAIGVVLAASNPVAAVLFLGLGLGLFIKGHDTQIPAKTKVKARVSRDILIRV